MKKTICVLLALVMTLCLGACGSRSEGDEGGLRVMPELSFEQKLARSAEELKEIESLHMDMDMDIGMRINVMGAEKNADVSTRYAADIRYDPMQLAIVMDVSAYDMQQKLLYYGEQAGDGLTVYISLDGGDHWSRQTISSVMDLMPHDPGEQAEIFLACVQGFAESGKENINGAPATVYTGAISGDYVEQAIKVSGSLDSVSQLLGTQVSEDMFRDLGSIPASIALDDESGMVVRYTMDMSQVMGTLVERIMAKMLEKYGEDAPSMEVKMEKVTLSMTLSQFNAVPEIRIPEAARGA